MTKPVDKDSLPLNKPRRTPNHPTKSHIVKTKVDGKEKIIRFGEQGAETAGKPKAGESDRMKAKRASFKARHAANIAKGKSSPAYWADKVKWNEGGMVKMASGGAVRMPRSGGAALALIEQMQRAGEGSEEFTPTLASLREQRSTRRPQAASQAVLQARPAPRAVAPAAPAEEPLPLPPTPPAMRPDENPPPEAPRNPMRFDEGNPHVATAISMAQRYNLPPSIFLSLVEQESGFNPAARSRRGAIGLGQLMPATAAELNVDPHDPVQNLEGSARYLRQMLDRFGSMELALAAYNAGPGRVRRAGNTIPNIRETQQYVPSVLRRAGASTGPEYAEGGLADLDQKYAEGGRVRRVAGAVARAVRGRREPEQPSTYPTATETPRFKVEPQPGQPFDDWIDSIYAPENRGPDNVSRFPSLMYRGVSDAELDAAIQGGSIRPLSGSGVYIENSPDRYVGGGAYGAKRAGAILQFDVGGLPSTDIASSHARDLMESGVPEIPLERITRIWRWDPDRKAHVLMPDEEAASLLRRNREQSGGSLEDLDQKYAEGGEVRTPEEEEYDRRLLSRMKAQTGRVTEPTRAEQMQALRTAGREAAEGLADVLLPQSPLDFALMAAFGPGGRAARLAGSAALASLEPSEAEASRFRRLIRAYHGSPHRFDEFDIRKIGTGEGAQAYGRGLYFAENEDIARSYRDKLSKDLFITPEGSLWSPYSLKHLNLRAVAAKNPDDLDVAIRRGEDFIDRMPPATRDLVESDLGVLRALRDAGGVSRNPGHMYEVDLNAAPREFLNWDIPLNEQSREVRESLLDLPRVYLEGPTRAAFENPSGVAASRFATGERIYRDLADAAARNMDLPTLAESPRGMMATEAADEVTRLLRNAGIPGTRYLDAGSRGVGGTYNYAVFDPEIIDIRRRYAEGGLAQLDQKYAEGGIVGAEAAKYDPDAVDALVKQIEAEYV